MKINANALKTKEVLTRNVAEVLPSRQGLESLMKKKRIRLYLGVDPTGSKLHLGHTIVLRKIQEFADLGHEVILLIGTGTVLAGDPSQRDKARAKISKKEIEENIKTWRPQVKKIINLSKVKIKYNGDWLLKLGLSEILNIASNISAVKLFQREMFQERIRKGGTVWLHEALYPLLQGYDSVALDADLEVGGTDQVFNMLIGRELQGKMKNREKFVLTCPMLLGIDGKQMSKSSGNCIWLDDSADQMFGKIMSIPDSLLISFFELLTTVPQKDIAKYEKDIQSGKVNPRDVKKILAGEVVKMYHSQSKAVKAEAEFERVFEEKGLPSKIPQIKLEGKALDILDLLVKTKLASSKSEAKRLVVQGGVRIDGRVEKDWRKTVEIKEGLIAQAGKRRFVKISL
ncbi:MAG: tyrosine--tRNA ligase [bacterium]|nr:tyrosine--tRNA ligase [bacterium]